MADEDRDLTASDKNDSGKEPDKTCFEEEYRRTAAETTDELQFLPELNFSTFILSLSTSVLVHLGELPDPITNERNVSLPLAKQTISIIEILQQKTRGNLTADEERLIEDILFDLRMKYVCIVKPDACR